MRRAGLTSPKLYTLAAELGISRAAAIGHLELMWDYTKDHAIQGNIGKWPNGAIARAADWLDDPDKFVDAMVKSGFLDPDLIHRLLVHDWHDHADRWVKASLEKQGLRFLTVPHQPDLPSTTVATTVPTTESTSSLASTSLASTSLDKKNGRAIALPPDFDLNPERLAFAEKKGVRDPYAELEAFRAYHEARGSTMKNWDAAWRTWCINSLKFGVKKHETNRPLSAVERVRRRTAEREAERQAHGRTLEADDSDLRSQVDESVR